MDLKDMAKEKESLTRDLISDLPSDVTENILERLFLKDAVRTSILSKEWRHKWVTLSILDFCCPGRNLSNNHNMKTVINQILLLHKGPIKEFIVRFEDLESFDALGEWLNSLPTHHLQKLCLYWWYDVRHYGQVPSNLFAFSQLRHLNLSQCVLRIPSSFKSFGRLATLIFSDVKIMSHELSSLISMSPFLEYLKLWDMNGFSAYEVLEIDAPKLKSFFFNGRVFSISFVNAPLLEEVYISLSRVFDKILPDKVKQDNFTKSLVRLPSITKLELKGFLETVALDGVWQNLTYDMSHLKNLQMTISSFDVFEVSCAIWLIKSAPNLELLSIGISASDQKQKSTAQFLKEQQNCGISLSYLKLVVIWWGDWLKPDTNLVNVILSFATALEEVILCSREVSLISDELVRFPRASPKAKFTFLHPY